MVMELFASKFGGSSLANGVQIEKVIDIVRSDARRKFVIVSAPGARHKGDHKVTDSLIKLKREHGKNPNLPTVAASIRTRFSDIAHDLRLNINLKDDLYFLGRPNEHSEDFVKSRGEYINAKILAEALGYHFVDAADIIKFSHDGTLDMDTTMKSFERLPKSFKGCVIPGFYGAMPNGDIKTFSRGGSDLTGALVAAMVDADLYENWTDVSGFLMADPRIVKDPQQIKTMTYEEAGELAYRGANVLHPETTSPVEEKGIPIMVLNTNAPHDPGTLIIPSKQDRTTNPAGSITGIAGRKGFVVISPKRPRMVDEVGFIAKVTTILAEHHVSIEHMPGGMRTFNIIVAPEQVEGKLPSIIERIEKDCAPVNVCVEKDLALVCVVGRGMAHTPGVSGKLFSALGDASVNVEMIEQGANELNIIFGVRDQDYDRAVRAAYHAFIPQ